MSLGTEQVDVRLTQILIRLSCSESSKYCVVLDVRFKHIYEIS